MKKTISNLLTLCAMMMGFVITGCGADGPANLQAPTGASKSTVFGVASLDVTADGTVSVKDSSMPAREIATTINSDGDYSVDVSGLKKPFILKADGIDQAGNRQTLYSVSRNGGRANINQLSDAAVVALSDNNDRHTFYNKVSREDEHHRNAERFEEVIQSLRTVLAPLFALYRISGNVVSDDDDDNDDDNSGLRAMLRDVRFVVTDGQVTVTNKQTGGVIFTGQLKSLAAGTFSPENMPGGSGGTTACTYTYDVWGACQSTNTQSRSLLTSLPAGCAGTPVLSQACTYVPPTQTACTYAYAGWGACQTNNTQTRNMLAATPTGCAGTPVLSQACTYVPPAPVDGAALYTQYCNGCHGSGKKGSSATAIQNAINNNTGGMGSAQLRALSAAQIQAIATGNTAPTPAACTTFTYSAFGACQSNNTQTRNLLTSSPAGCVGGTPVLSQACTYVPPAPAACTTFTYSAFGACQSNNTQSRNLLTSSPAGCVGGTPVLSQACTYVPPQPADGASLYTGSCAGCHGALASSTKKGRTAAQIQSAISGNTGGMGSLSGLTTAQIQAIATALVVTTPPPAATCGSCHAIPPSNGKHAFHSSRATCATCHGTGYSTTAVNAATHQNGTINIASTPGWNPSSRSCSNSCHGSKSW